MPTAADLERALAAANLAAPVRWDEVTGSTNATAMELAEQGAPEWTLVGAGHQRAGRGRLGRSWRDRPGRSLMASLVLRPELRPGDAGLVAVLAGAAMAEAATEIAETEVRSTWPNDLMIGSKKVGGILVESSIVGGAVRFAVLGFGINLEPPLDLPGAAGLGRHVDPIELLSTFLRGFSSAYRPGAPEWPAEVVERWTRVADTLGRQVRASRTDGEVVRGRAARLDAHGGLVVETTDGPHIVAFGEVLHLD